jgi:hypothetical protein
MDNSQKLNSLYRDRIRSTTCSRELSFLSLQTAAHQVPHEITVIERCAITSLLRENFNGSWIAKTFFFFVLMSAQLLRVCVCV